MRDKTTGEKRISARSARYEARPLWERELLAFVGLRIREGRRARGLTIKALAREVGLDPAFLGELERGRETISISTLAQVAVVLHQNVAAFFPTSAKIRSSIAVNAKS